MSMTVKARITVLGVDPALRVEAVAARLSDASLVVGGRRHLSMYAKSIGDQTPTITIGGELLPALDAIDTAEGNVYVLASGDPGFFGIVRALAERFGRERLDVVPGASSVAQAFAAIGLPWDDAVVVSAHGRELHRAINVARAFPKVAILTAPGAGPAEIAAGLIGTGRTVFVAERLGEPYGGLDSETDPAEIAAREWSFPNVVLVLDESRAVPAKGALFPRVSAPTGWALDESEFEHRDGMVTKAEVRALALARLGPGLGDLIWDVGAGSGSVGIECARFGAAVVAVERDAAMADLIRENAHRHGVDIRVVEGNAGDHLAELPDPDAVFVGGSGDEFDAVLAEVVKRTRRAVVVALASIERVPIARDALHANGFRTDVLIMQTSRLRAIGPLHGFAANNPVFLVSGVRA